jgi:hypothetical protein
MYVLLAVAEFVLECKSACGRVRRTIELVEWLELAAQVVLQSRSRHQTKAVGVEVLDLFWQAEVVTGWVVASLSCRVVSSSLFCLFCFVLFYLIVEVNWHSYIPVCSACLSTLHC